MLSGVIGPGLIAGGMALVIGATGHRKRSSINDPGSVMAVVMMVGFALISAGAFVWMVGVWSGGI